MAGTSQPEEEAFGALTSEWPPDTHAQRYVVRLRTLPGAVEALEGE